MFTFLLWRKRYYLIMAAAGIMLVITVPAMAAAVVGKRGTRTQSQNSSCKDNTYKTLHCTYLLFVFTDNHIAYCTGAASRWALKTAS